MDAPGHKTVKTIDPPASTGYSLGTRPQTKVIFRSGMVSLGVKISVLNYF